MTLIPLPATPRAMMLLSHYGGDGLILPDEQHAEFVACPYCGEYAVIVTTRLGGLGYHKAYRCLVDWRNHSGRL